MRDNPRQSGPLHDKLSAEQLDVILRELDSLGTLPAVTTRLLELTKTIPSGQSWGETTAVVEEVLGLVSSDPSLTAKLLSLANRSSPQPTRTVAQAVERLGADALRSAVLSTFSAKVCQRSDLPDDGGGLDRPGFWRHCLAVASAAEILAERSQPMIPPQEAFVCGLLHDVGKLVLQQCLPKSYQRVIDAVKTRNGNIADLERSIIGLDHSVVGRRLAEYWQLGEEVTQVIWLHHQPIEAIPSLPGRALAGLVSLADAIARRQRLGFSGNYTFPYSPEQLAGQLRIDQATLEDVAAGLAERVERRCALVGLSQSDSLSRYRHRQVRASANAELGRLYEELLRKTGSLSQRSAALGHLCDFTSALRPGDTVADVILRIAATVADVFDSQARPRRPIVAYSLGEAVIAVCRSGSGSPTWRTFQPGDSSDPSALDAHPGPADEATSRLFGEDNPLAEWVDLTIYTHCPLICADRRVGAMLYPTRREDRDKTQEVCKSLAPAMAMALLLVQQRCGATLLSEQLAARSQELVEAQESLGEAKTLAALGEMAAGAAHELNNPLAVVSGRAQLMQNSAATEEERKTWRLIAEQAHLISNTITELMDFACPPEPKTQVFDLPALLKDVADEFYSSDHIQAKTARVDIQIAQAVPPVSADRAQIRSVVLELIANAANAATCELHITLTAEADEPNQTVVLTVRDNGPGMEPARLAQAFTPFFSSQRSGRRRGLGLPRAKRYVQINGGRIWIESHSGEGTAIYVELPSTDSHAANTENSDAQ